MPPNPPSNAHGFAMRSMSLRGMQIPKSEKINSWPPPLPNPGDAPDQYWLALHLKFGSVYITVEDWYNHQISNLLQKKTTKTKQ